MKKQSLIFILMIGLAWTHATGCSTDIITNQGVELGNPEPTPPTIRITPQGGMTTYELSFLDGNRTSVKRTDPSAVTENIVLASYQRSGTVITVQANFPGLETIDVTISLSAKGAILSVDLKINGQEVASAFESSGNFPTMGDNSGGKKVVATQYEGETGDDRIGPPNANSDTTADTDQPNSDELNP